MNRWKWNVIAICSLLCAAPAWAATSSLPNHVRHAAIRVLQINNISVHGMNLSKFMRFDAAGNIEGFECEFMATFETAHRSGARGGVTIGQCEKNSSLDENFATGQTKNYLAAVAAAEGAKLLPVGAVNTAQGFVKSKIAREQGTIFIQLSQFLLPGVGGAGGHGFAVIDTVLVLPEKGKKVILVQAMLGDRECDSLEDAPKPPSCASNGTLLDVARQITIALEKPAPEPAYKLEPISPGRTTICDSIAYAIAETLVESDERHVPVSETRYYKRHAGQPEIQTPMQLAGVEHAQGASIFTAAMNAGRQCYQKGFEKK